MKPSAIRRIILEQSKRANVGHIGSCLSIVEILVTLFDKVMNIPSPEDKNRDRLILSKGHAALGLYAALYLKNWLDEEGISSFLTNNSLLGVHPEVHLRGIDFSTGSLGQGLSFAVGAALAARIQGSSRQVYVVLSDAELNEGSVWEALMFAGHHALGNLTAIVDLNAQQALDQTKNVIHLPHIAKTLKSFNWVVQTVNGHDIEALEKAIQLKRDKPSIILAKTTFGKGVSYMESQVKWHYWPMSDEEYQIAIKEVEEQEQARLASQ